MPTESAALNDQTLTPAITARLLLTTEKNLAKMRSEGNGPPFIKLGRNKIGYLATDVEAYLLARRCQNTAEGNGLVGDIERPWLTGRKPANAGQ